MEEITLQPVTPENWQDVIDLKVREDQKDFVATNLFSLAEAKVYPECVPMAIYAGEKPVGFLMHGISREDGRYWLIRYMIDKRYQGRGYGKAAMRLFLDLVRPLPGCDRLYLSYEPGNAVAEQLYAGFGFQPTGEFLEGEKVACLDFIAAED